jgi:hypothetical protein
MSRGILGFVGRVIGRDPAQRAYAEAVSQAKRDVSDESAAAMLRAQIRDIPTSVIDREIREWGRRQDYLQDRAYRLLVAARDGGSVAPIQASDQGVFEQEALLGRLPMADAFQRLADAEPELRRWEELALAGKKAQPGDVSRLVGPSARNSDAVLQGDLALKIATIYLWDCRGGRNGDPRSYFDRAQHHSHGTIPVSPMEG